MKRLSILIAGMLIPAFGFAQKIVYTYDASGNRISRLKVSNTIVQAPPRRESGQQNDDLAAPTVSVGPTPTTGPLTVSLSCLGDTDDCCLLLTNMAGQTLLSQPMNTTEAMLDLSAYATGCYLLQVVLNGNSQTYKIIKK